MRKKYNIFLISRLYLKSYYNFILNRTNISKSSEAFSLFMYSIKSLYGLDTVEYCDAVSKYGDACIEYLKNVEGTPKVRDKMSFEDKVRLVNVCEGYALTIDVLTRKYIINGRLKEG